MSSMPHAVPGTQPDPDSEQVILGVDTHKDVHVAAVITVLGVGLASAEFATTAAGYRQLLAWARGFGVLHRAGSGGHRLLRRGPDPMPAPQQVTVVEVNRPDRAARRRHGKTDAVDALAAAHAVLSGRANGTAKTGDGPVEMLRMFRLARTSAVKARTQAINQLKAVIVGADPALRESLSGLSRTALIRHCASLPDTAPTDVAHRHHLHPAPPGPAHPSTHRRGTAAAKPHHRRAQHPRTTTVATPWHRTRQRRRPAGHRRRQPRPHDQRSLLRRPVRRQPHRGVLRQNPPATAQPRR